MIFKGFLFLLLLATQPFFRNLIADTELFFALLLGFHGIPWGTFMEPLRPAQGMAWNFLFLYLPPSLTPNLMYYLHFMKGGRSLSPNKSAEIYSAAYFPVNGYHAQRLRLLRHGLIQALNDGVRNLCLSIFNTAFSVKTQFSSLFPYTASMATNSFRPVLCLVPTISGDSDACLIA